MANTKVREAFLSKIYPILYIKFLEAMQRNDDLSEFCKGLRDDYKHYTFYIVHYLVPWFESLRRQNRITEGNTAHFKR